MNYIVIGSTGFIGSKVYASLKLDSKNSVVGISSNQVDLYKTDSYKKLKNLVTADSIIIMCAGVKKQLGDNVDIFEKNLIIINNFIRDWSTVAIVGFRSWVKIFSSKDNISLNRDA